MRICLVAFQFWPSVGGSQTQVEKQAKYLRQLGQEVLVVTLRHQKTWLTSEEYANFPVIRVGGLYGSSGRLRVGRFGHLFVDLLLFLTLWRLRQRYDLIHAFQVSPLAVMAALVGRLVHKPVIISVQSTGPYEYWVEKAPQRESESAGSDGEQKDSRDGTGLQREVGGDLAALKERVWGGLWMLDYLRKANVYYHILSSRSYAYLVQHGFRPDRIIYIPNGVDTQQFYPAIWRRETASERTRKLLCVARLEYAKGIDVLLRAWTHLMNMPGAWRGSFLPRLCLAGDGTCRMELEKLAEDLGVRDSVEFLGTRHDIACLMQDAWAFVLPSRWEGMPNALLEAMACRLPCVATRVSGSEDVIEQGVNGLLVEPEQPEQLAYALRLLIEDANLAQQLSWQGYKTVLSYYQLSSTVQASLTFYQYLVHKKNTFEGDPSDYEQMLSLSPEEWQHYE